MTHLSIHKNEMCIVINYLLLATLVAANLGAKLPNYIKRCSLSDPGKGDCFVKHGNEAIPIFTKGDKAFKIPNLAPAVIPEVILEPGNNLKIVNHDVTSDNIKDLTLTALDFDFDKKHLKFILTCDRMMITSKYEISGQISLLPVNGNGDFNVTFTEPVFTYDADFTTETKNGEDYLKIVKSNFDYTTKRGYFYFGNLFNGDERLGSEVNKFVDENWTEFNKELAPAIKEAMKSVVEIVLNGYFKRIPIKDVFVNA